MHREPEVQEAEAQVEKWLDWRARITKMELAPFHSVKSGILQSACSTRQKMHADLEKSDLMRIARLMNSLAKGLKRMVTNAQWLCWKSTRQLGCVFQDMEAQKSTTTEELKQTEANPIVRFTEAVLRHIRDQNPSRGMICSGDPQHRNPNAPKFEDRSQEETEWQE